MPNVRTKGNRLSAYGFSCSYQEIAEKINTEKTGFDAYVEWIRFWKEGEVYHVRRYNNEKGKRVYWKSFETLKEARAFFDKEWRGLKKGCVDKYKFELK